MHPTGLLVAEKAPDTQSVRSSDGSDSDTPAPKPPQYLLAMGGGKPFPPTPAPALEYTVAFDGPHDTLNPRNWPARKKHFAATIVCVGTFVAAFNSALFAEGTARASTEFGVGSLVGTLGTSLFILGFSFGPPLWAPASELVGRRWPLILGMVGSSIFTLGAAAAKDIQTLVICRFFAGVAGASPYSVVPAVLADLYDDADRGIAIALYSLVTFVGPFAAPFIGGFVTESALGWRWTLYLPAIMGLLDAVLLLGFLDESFAPFILVDKAFRVRQQTGNWAVHAPQEHVQLDVRHILRNYFARPMRMLVTEPILLLLSVYMSFLYGLSYALLKAYPYVFEHIHGMRKGISGLPFFGLILGQVFAVLYILSQHSAYVKRLAANNNISVPEWRLRPANVGSCVFPVGLFWFAWTGFTPDIHWMAPTAAGIFVGFGFLCVFLPCFTYLVDAYLPIAASAVAANVMLRSAIAAGFPLFSRQMFENLGVQWAGTLLGCIAVLMIPIPIAFTIYGKKLRSKSRFLKNP